MARNDFRTETTTHVDDRGGQRTAIVVGKNPNGGSIDVLDDNLKRVAQINVFVMHDGDHVIVDVIDVENRYTKKRALTDPGSNREDRTQSPFNFLVSADLKKGRVCCANPPYCQSVRQRNGAYHTAHHTRGPSAIGLDGCPIPNPKRNR